LDLFDLGIRILPSRKNKSRDHSAIICGFLSSGFANQDHRLKQTKIYLRHKPLLLWRNVPDCRSLSLMTSMALAVESRFPRRDTIKPIGSRNRAVDRFWKWSDQGRLLIVIDNSSCTYGLLTCQPYLKDENQRRFEAMRIIDGVAFAHDELLPQLRVSRKVGAVALHPVCPLAKMNLAPRLEAIGRACSETIFVPQQAGCCGFAGDRGWLFPELTEAATRTQSAEAKAGKFDGYFSSSRTCEVGMTRAVGRIYRSYIDLLEETTR
jgi:hypothetical protein